MTKSYRIVIDYINEAEPIVSNPTNEEGYDETDDTIFGWSFSIVINNQNDISSINQVIGTINEKSFNDLIRHLVIDYKHITRFHHFRWIVEDLQAQQISFVIHFSEESLNFESFINNLKAELIRNRLSVKKLEIIEIDFNEFCDVNTSSMEKGHIECSTAWESAAGRYEYIHELYEKD